MSPIGINCSEQLGGIWQVHTYWCLTQCTGLPEVESLVSLFGVSVCMMWDELWKIELLLFCWDRNLIYENIYCFENSLAYPSFCVLCVLFLKLRWSCILHGSIEFDRWCESQWIVIEKLHFILFVIFMKIFLLDLLWRSIFLNTLRRYWFLY